MMQRIIVLNGCFLHGFVPCLSFLALFYWFFLPSRGLSHFQKFQDKTLLLGNASQTARTLFFNELAPPAGV